VDCHRGVRLFYAPSPIVSTRAPACALYVHPRQPESLIASKVKQREPGHGLIKRGATA